MDKQENIIYLDVETQLLSDDVGGWGHIDKMKVAIVVIYSSKEDKFYHFTEGSMFYLLDKLKEATLVVGFNIKNFDYKVMQPYYLDFDLKTLPTYDILEESNKKLGHRISLQAFAEPTLNIGKSADGLKAVEWFKSGEIQKIIDYCKQDVIVTRDLYLFAERNGYLKFNDKKTGKEKVVFLEV